MPKRTWLFWLTAILVAWGFDLLFWNTTPGISLSLWILLVLAAGVSLLWSEGKKPSLWNIILIALALAAAFVPAVRNEPLTNFLAFDICFLSLFLLAFSYEKAHWIYYRIQDHIKALLRLIGGMFARPLGVGRPAVLPTKPPPLPRQNSRIWVSVLRGVLIAIPVLGIFAALLSAADPVFSQWLAAIINLQKLPEYIFRLIYILILGYLITGVYMYAAYPAKGELKPDDSQVIVKPFIGWIESSIVLLLVDILFISFIILQLRYLFGAQAGSGFTYSEYARRGFFELVAVAVISLLLYLALGTVTRRESKFQKNTCAVLSCLLIVLVLVILVSSYQRLAQYEQAYGFSRLRTYTHIFIIWLAVLLFAALGLEIARQQRWLGAGLLLCVLGFGVTLASLNVDGFIVRQNLKRVAAGYRFDTEYLSTLSSDAVPEIIEAFQDPSLESGTRDGLGANLACRLAVLDAEKRPWQSFNFGDLKARQLLHQINPQLQEYPVTSEYGVLEVRIAGHLQDCFPPIPIDTISN